jgi:hypothetical protein
LTQSEEQINQDFHSAIQSVGVISMIPQANWVDNEVLPEVCPFMSSHRSFHV